MKKGRIFQEQGAIDPDTNMPGVSKAKQSPMWPEGKTERQQGVGLGGWEGPTLQGHAEGSRRKGCRGAKTGLPREEGDNRKTPGTEDGFRRCTEVTRKADLKGR